MDQDKIGKFIATCRKEKGYTQEQLAFQLGISDKAVSKWERGISFPNVSILITLCTLLDISVNELLLGEHISEDNLKEKSEEVLMEVITHWLGKEQEVCIDRKVESEIVLRVEDVVKQYEDVCIPAVNHVSFTVVKGEFIGIMGASGSGKTTLLNMIATMDIPTSGTIMLQGEPLSTLSEKQLAKFRRTHLGFVFQEYNLLPTLSIYENIAMALMMKGIEEDTMKERIATLAKRLDIQDILMKYPHEVSGGQRQRCACARAIAVQPTLILADEPTGALDSHAAAQVLETLQVLQQEYGATILMVTHDARCASYCDRIFFLADGSIKKILERHNETKQAFFTNILDTLASIESEQTYVS